MATIAGYTICFLFAGDVKQLTMANPDDDFIERFLRHRFDNIQILSRTPLDARTLARLKLAPGEWMEWAPVAGPFSVARGTRHSGA